MLTLSVPKIDHSVQPHKVDTQPKATMEWLSRLPFANPIDTAQQLVLALYTLNLKVGDALALCAEDSVVWSLAIIRWVKMRDARQVELGVERLSPQIQPVWVRPRRSHRKASPEPGLFVPGVPALKQPDRLLLPSHIYQTGMDAEVLHTPQQYTVKFDRRAEFTPSFDLINFTVLTQVPAQ